MKKIFERKYILFEVLVLFILSLTPLLWFKPQHIVIGVDSGYPVDYIKYFQQRQYTWLGSQNFGIDMSAEVGVVPYNAIPALVNYAGVGRFDVQKIVFVFWFFLILSSIYSFLFYLFPKKDQWLIRLSGAVLYSFNLHIYSFWLQGEQPILASYVLLPWFILFLLRFIQGKTSALKTAIYLNLVFVLLSSGGVRGLPLVAPVILSSFIFVVYYAAISFKKGGVGYFKRYIPLILYGGVFFAFLNSYFLIPFLSSFALQYSNQVAITGGVGGAVDWAKFISTYTSFTNLFRLNGDNNWYNKPYLWAWAYLTNPILIIGSFIFPLLAFAAILFVKIKEEKRIIFLFTIVALLGLFFSAGAHPPLGTIYILMMEKIPGFAAFRSGYYKFIPTVYFAYAVLVGYSLYTLANKSPKKIRVYVGIISIFLILLYHYPYFTNANFAFNKPFTTMVKIPAYINDFAKMENQLPDRYRTLVVPPPSDAFNIKAFSWGYWSSYPIFPLITDRNFVVNDVFVFNDSENKLITSMYDSLRRGDLTTFHTAVKTTNVKYVLVTRDIARNFFMSLTEDPKVYDKILTTRNGFKKIWNEGPWTLYEITNVKPSKIEAFSSATLNDGTADSIGTALKINAIPFVDKQTNDLSHLPISKKLSIYPCLSCHMLDTVGPGINTPSIYPDSLLYPLKLSEEKDIQNAVTNSQKIDAYIGLSLKRINEINKLNISDVSDEASWINASDLLNSYWKNISNLYKNNYQNAHSYPVLLKISQYLVFEKAIENNVINIRNLNRKSGLGLSLQKTINIQTKINKTLDSKINEQDWKNVFVYDVTGARSISLNENSLNVDSIGQAILPTKYSINGVEYPYLNEPIITSSKGTNILYLFFNLPNLFSNPEVKTKMVDGRKRSCVQALVSNYSGTKNYLITVSVNEQDHGTMLIKRDYDVLQNQDLVNQPLLSPDYDTAVDVNTLSTGKFQYSFLGKANDRSVLVYFCTGSASTTPEKVFRDITITEVINPQIYSVVNKKQTFANVPTTSYSKITPDHYTVQVESATQPFILSFSERFSPLWEAYINGKKVDQHFVLNGFSNGWYIKKAGSYTVEIKFKAQKEVEAGVAISVASFVILLIYSLFTTYKNEKKKK